jgi:hypothetical protein
MSLVANDEVVALWRRVKPRLRDLGGSLGPSLNEEQRHEFDEYLDANELGIALEMLAYWLSENETPIRDESRSMMLESAREMGIESQVADPLQYCPRAQ